ncbi:MAG: hypothetical protein U0231_08020 [Nitrospiraceae bacterium]
MATQPMTPAEAASALYKLLPRYLSPEFLSDYGLDVSESQAGDITREVLSFNLYWVSAAINAHIPRQYREVLFNRVLELIQAEWGSAFKSQDVEWKDFLTEAENAASSMRRWGNFEGGAEATSERLADILEDIGAIQSATGRN